MAALRQSWIAAIAVVAGMMIAVGAGVYTFARATASPPLFATPDSVPSAIDAAPAPSRFAEAVKAGQRVARDTIVEQDLPGLSVAVGVDDADGKPAIVWAEGFGWADVERRVPVTARTRFRIGHTSIAVTSAAIGQLLDQRRVNLDDEIQKYVPEFPRKPWPITLRQLMAHVAGVRHYNDEAEYMTTAHCDRAAGAVGRFADDPLLFEPETDYKYSTYGWVLVSAAIEAIAAQPFFAFMKSQVFDRAGMIETTFDGVDDRDPNRAIDYAAEWNGVRHPAAASDYSCFSGAGAIVSTPTDLVRFGLAFNRGALVDPFTVTRFQTMQRLQSGADTGYGLGWMLDMVPIAGRPTKLASHASRTLVGASATFMIFPEHGLVVAATGNIAYASTRAMALQIADAFVQAMQPPKPDRAK